MSNQYPTLPLHVITDRIENLFIKPNNSRVKKPILSTGIQTVFSNNEIRDIVKLLKTPTPTLIKSLIHKPIICKQLRDFIYFLVNHDQKLLMDIPRNSKMSYLISCIVTLEAKRRPPTEQRALLVSFMYRKLIKKICSTYVLGVDIYSDLNPSSGTHSNLISELEKITGQTYLSLSSEADWSVEDVLSILNVGRFGRKILSVLNDRIAERIQLNGSSQSLYIQYYPITNTILKTWITEWPESHVRAFFSTLYHKNQGEGLLSHESLRSVNTVSNPLIFNVVFDLFTTDFGEVVETVRIDRNPTYTILIDNQLVPIKQLNSFVGPQVIKNIHALHTFIDIIKDVPDFSMPSSDILISILDSIYPINMVANWTDGYLYSMVKTKSVEITRRYHYLSTLDFNQIKTSLDEAIANFQDGSKYNVQLFTYLSIPEEDLNYVIGFSPLNGDDLKFTIYEISTKGEESIDPLDFSLAISDDPDELAATLSDYGLTSPSNKTYSVSTDSDIWSGLRDTLQNDSRLDREGAKKIILYIGVN